MADKDFTTRELEIMAKAWNCFTTEPQVDYKKLSEECGMTNVRSASNAWGLIKKKIMAKGGGKTGSETNGTAKSDAAEVATPKSSPKKRGAPKADKEESPTKKAKGGRKTKAQKEAEAAEAAAASEEGSASPVKGEPVEDFN
ncbi:hypothetical protein LTR97_005142 [Elasticomyces elasticus]|uniref:Uncharacterized protein n=1 Tax=Elasticomyces elasticus TaxID=574655 RepID=A0AAN7W6M8_9PEZI|nr:hypothetical protein LTR97_005142 [Elasticomyces elasticus]